MKQAARLLSKGHKLDQIIELSNHGEKIYDCLPVLKEYSQRKKLAGLGYRFNRISAYKVNCFMIIEDALAGDKDGQK